ADGTQCGDPGSACVNQDTCQSGVCLDNGFPPAGTPCGALEGVPAGGECDSPDTCDGHGSCQANHVPDGSPCGDPEGACVNQDACLAGQCHDNGYKTPGTPCGDATSGACDAADTCDGAGACQANHEPAGT